MKNFIYVAMVSFIILITGGCGDKENKQTTQAAVPNQQNSTATNQKQADQKANPKACYFQKLADFQADNDKNTPVTNDMMEEWHDECKYNPDLENSESESASFEDDGKNNTVVASTTTTTAAPVKAGKPPLVNIEYMTGGVGIQLTVMHVKFTATEDSQTISNVLVNRGNCRAEPEALIKTDQYGRVDIRDIPNAQPSNSNTLKFGQSHKYLLRCQQVLEVTATVNGTNFKWDFSN